MKRELVVGGVVVGVVALLVVTLVPSSLKKLNSDEVGIIYDTMWRSLKTTARYEGLHTGPPGFRFIKFPSIYKTLAFDSISCLNKDGVPIVLDVSYQYQARPQNLQRIILQFRDHEGYERVLQAAGKSAIHEACSKFNTSQFQSDRGRFQEDVLEQLVHRYGPLMCDITDLQVNNIARPSAYEKAIKDKEAAKENIKLAAMEKPRKLTEAQTLMRQAETQANITMAQAMSQARILINSALLEAEAIKQQFETEANTYEKLISSSGLQLTTEGFLSYMGIRVIEGAKNPVYIGLKGPAKSSYVP